MEKVERVMQFVGKEVVVFFENGYGNAGTLDHYPHTKEFKLGESTAFGYDTIEQGGVKVFTYTQERLNRMLKREDLRRQELSLRMEAYDIRGEILDGFKKL